MNQPPTTCRHMPGNRHGSFGDFSIALLLSAALGFCGYFIAGNSLDLFLGGTILGALTVPSLTTFAGRSPGAVVAVCVGVGCSWLMPVFGNAISIGQWGTCVLLLASFLAAVWSLVRLGIHPAIIVLAVIAWLTWPIWLSASLPGSRAHLSVVLHPLFAINKTVDNLGIWTEQQAAYGLTNLGQDVQYAMPTSAWPAILFHFGIALVAWITSVFIAPRSMNQMDTDANAVKNK